MTDRTALVVGASRGLGLGLARELSGRGWRVIGTRRSPASDKGLQDLADSSGGKVRIETLDMEDSAAIEGFGSRLGGESLDLLFVNAGISGPHGRAGQASRDGVAQLFMTNVVAPIHLAEALAPQVRDGQGVIAFMSSGLGSVSRPFDFPDAGLYCASKAALNRMVRAFVSDLGGRKLTVLAMSPGWVRTDMGGPGAPLSIEQSVKGVIDVVEAKAGTGEHGFYDHDGSVVPW
jgi:NAD(P)-dependent dehydrogenase (short-subunit alcohol dehydrogenase family)